MLSILLTFWLAPVLGQTTYYVAGTGNDANNGQSPNAPFQTLAKVNSLSLQPGDAVLFRRGDTFRGTLTIRQSGTADKPITIDAYGNGSKPVIAGSVPIIDWTNTGGNNWQAVCTSCGSRITGLYNNGSVLPLGRYPNLNTPNKGYLTIQAHAGKTQLTSKQALTTDWTGGEAVVRPVQWILDRATITQQNGNVLTLSNTSGYELKDGWGYFIQNHPATLDQTGEWYYNPATKTIQLYYDLGNPNDLTLSATNADNGLTINKATFIVIRNLQITQTRSIGLYAINTSNLTLSNNDIINSGEDAVLLDGSGSNILAENNWIDRANNNGFEIRQYQNVTIRGNTIRRVGLVPGRSKSGDGQAIGFQSAGDGAILIENNTLDSLGYNGIVFQNNATIRRNTISSFCLTKSDGGGIYTWNGNKQTRSNIAIYSNIVYNGVGASEGAPNGAYSGANGIYMDDCAQNIGLSNNTVFDCTGLGFYLHATNNISVTGNTSFNNTEGQFMISHNNGVCPARNNVLHDNIFVSKLSSQLVAKYESTDSDLTSYGSFDKNIYARPFDDLFKIRAVSRSGGTITGNDLTLPEWYTQFKQDPNSKDSPVAFKGYVVQNSGSTYRLNNTFASTNEGWSTWGPYNNGKAQFDNTGKLDGNSLRVDFPSASGKADSYMIVTNGIGSINKGKNYLLRFDAIASGSAKKVQVFLRQQDAGYQDVSNRSAILVTTSRKSYEVAFTATADESKAITVFQVNEDGQTVWLDNIRLLDVTITPASPSDSIRLIYNPTMRDSLVRIDGNYQDVKNNPYSNQQILAPFTSAVLMKSPVPTAQPAAWQPLADLMLTLQTSQRYSSVGETVQISLQIRNSSNVSGTSARAEWSCRLPPNLQVVTGDGLQYTDGVLSGTVKNLGPLADTTFLFQVKPLAAGLFSTAAQITSASLRDPDSNPDSGTADGEDDSAMIDIRVGDPASNVFTSPNPNQKPLPNVTSSQPLPDPNKADICLRMSLSSCVAALNDIINCTLTVSNSGGTTATSVQVQNQLPDGLQFVSGDGWSINNRTLTYSIGSLAAGQSANISFKVRVTTNSRLINQSQISACDTPDIDSTPGNGFINGEDDQAQADIRVR